MDDKKITLLRELLLEAAAEIESLEKQRDEIDARIEKLHSAAFADFYEEQREEETSTTEEVEEIEPSDEETILRHLERSPGQTRSELVNADVLHDNNVLQRMRRRGMIVSKGHGKSSRWYTVAD